MEQSIFDIMTAKQIAELYIIFLGVTALLVAVSSLIFTILFENKTKKEMRNSSVNLHPQNWCAKRLRNWLSFEKRQKQITSCDEGKVRAGGIVSQNFKPVVKIVNGVPVCVNANPSERVLKLSSDGKWIDVTEHPDTAVW